MKTVLFLTLVTIAAAVILIPFAIHAVVASDKFPDLKDGEYWA
jgi:hypothetical protein